MIEPPRVLIVAEHASAQFGGEAALPLHYFRVLRQRGVPVWLLVHERTRSELLRLCPNDAERLLFVPDTVWHKWLWRVSQRLPARLAVFSTGLAMRLATQWAQRKLIRELVGQIGITVIHQPMPVSPREPSLLYGMGAPVVIGPMNGGMDYPRAFRHLQGRLGRMAVGLGRATADVMNRLIPGKRQAACLLVANERTRAALPACLADVSTQVLVENGVDMALWDSPLPTAKGARAGLTRYVYMGRLVDWKAVDLLLLAFARAAAHTEISLEIIGDGPERAALEALANVLGVFGASGQARQVHFAGWLSQAECAATLRQSDALVLPSLMECGGAVVLEAMAMAKPVIATNWGGPADYLDASCGILVSPSGRDSFMMGLVAAMQDLASDARRRHVMGLAGRARVLREFDWEVKIERMLQIYAQVQA